MIESGAYGHGTLTSIMKEKCYNHGVRAHKITMEALFRLMRQSFFALDRNYLIQHGTSEQEEAFGQNGKILAFCRNLKWSQATSLH